MKYILLLIIFSFSCNSGDLKLYPSWGKVMVTNYGLFDGSTVSIVDGHDKKIESTLLLGAAVQITFRVAANNVTKKFYVSNHHPTNGQSVSVIDGTNNSIIKTITGVPNPTAIAVNTVTNMVYVCNDVGNQVTVINGSSDIKTGSTVVTGTSPVGIAVNPNTNKVYTANSGGGGSYTVINGDTLSATTFTDPSLNACQGVAVNPNTNKIYVSNFGNNTVSVINGETNLIEQTLTGYFADPVEIAVNTKTNRIYVCNSNATTGNSVVVIDGNNHSVIAILTGFSGPYEPAVHETTNTIYVSNYGSDSITAIDGETHELTTIYGFIGPIGVAVLE